VGSAVDLRDRHLVGLRAHLAESRAALDELAHHLDEVDRWAEDLAEALGAGRRMLVAGNGGSAALAAHLVAELVGRFRTDRPAYSALALHAEGATLTALGNDYGFDAGFSRQVEAHGRRGDVLVLVSTSGRSPNLLRAAERADELGLASWALTGPGPNPLAERCRRAICVGAASTAAVQEAHQVAVHLLCVGFDERVLACASPHEATG
jgi:D-sedoheptulose 7-phosphate isomerase